MVTKQHPRVSGFDFKVDPNTGLGLLMLQTIQYPALRAQSETMKHYDPPVPHFFALDVNAVRALGRMFSEGAKELDEIEVAKK